MAKKVSKDTPLMEVTLRRYEKPHELEGRELIRKFCLSIGLLQPGDSRDVIVDILYALLIARKDNKHLTSEMVKEKVIEVRTNFELPQFGIASSNIRRQLKRLRDLLLVEKIKNNYRITEFASLKESYKERFQQYLIPTITSRIEEYFHVIDEKFG